ncbi:hypothetical protein J2Z44_000979 [Clostridium punense]|uniref:HipA N-terminal subdomain 1 domain-containing protein n=1 Tax=Clostridium punense TaxID=1054297 RepID=A0ABS4K078_9CLOT|nr:MULTISPECIES: hypothetical protein [Clostridium]EQB90261.1 hypothetical protein M918_01035 [Clostridium sp. BL8]MBP2021192.1 hypothetical protein [Clostridium punense]
MEHSLNLVWKNENGDSFNVGQLSFRSEKYYFQYDQEGVKKAKDSGFEPLPSFPRTNSKYFKEELFTTFRSWLGEKDHREHKEEVTLETLKNLGNGDFQLV